MPQQDQEFVKLLMEKSNKLTNDLNDFNIKYAKYVKCNGETTLSNSCSSTDLNCCSQQDKDINVLKTAQGKVNDDITAINTILNNNKANALNISDYNSNHSQIINNEEEIKKMRSELDTRMKEIYKLQDTKFNDNSTQYDSVLYTGVLFSILATSILYYTFTNL